MSANLHELTKQLDVLSWNSRSVLNALIRSVMKAGSSNGFSITRAGKELTLTREDISRIYDFYEEWESIGYDSSAFNKLLEEVASRYEDGALVKSLVTHAQIIMMDYQNVDNFDNPTYWIEKIYNIDNPKWFTNTAPIPLSIRTPIYDENLSTKHYDEYETYLFPSGYYSMDSLGYSGDGYAHTGGGQSWNFDVDTTFRINADRIVLGVQDKELADAFSSAYSTNSPIHSLAGGNNSFAYGVNSFAYGDSNQAYGMDSAVIGGYWNSALGSMSGILGGRENAAVSLCSAIAGGLSNNVVAQRSFAANSSNHVGGYNYPFTRQVISSGEMPTTECRDEYTDPETGCKYARIGNEVSVGTVSISSDELFIADKEINYSLVPRNMDYSTGINTNDPPVSPLDFRIGDTISIHSYTLANESYKPTKACSPITAKVLDIKLADSGVIVRLDKNLNATNITGLGASVITGGKICRYSSKQFVKINTYTGLSDGYDESLMVNCGAFGYNNISCGQSQLVVGSSNNELQRPRFIVGVGPTSYVRNDEHQIRQNGFVVAPGYLYGSTSHYVMFGASNFSTAMLSKFGDVNDPTTPIIRATDEDYYLYGVEKYEGFYAYADSTDTNNNCRSVVRVSPNKSLLMRGENGLQMQFPKSYLGTNNVNVQTELFSHDGSISIRATTRTETTDNVYTTNPSFGDGWFNYYALKFGINETDKRHIELWAKDNVGICGNKVIITAGSVDTTSSAYGLGQLDICGYSYQSLTAWPTETWINNTSTMSNTSTKGLYAYPYSVNGSPETLILKKRIDTITDCGHYYGFTDSCGVTTSDPDFGQIMQSADGKYRTLHSFVSAQIAYGSNSERVGYDVASLVLPGGLLPLVNSRTTTADLPHPFISISMVNMDGTTSRDAGNGFIVKELAYRSDVESSKVTVLRNIGVLPYVINTLDASAALDRSWDPNRSQGGIYLLSDSFLRSLTCVVGSVDPAIYHNLQNRTITENENRTGYIINNVASFSLKANETTHTDYVTEDGSSTVTGGQQFFMDGIKINPLMRAELRSISGDNVLGVSYMALGTPYIMCSPIDDTDEVSDEDSDEAPDRIAWIYNTQLKLWGPTWGDRTLHTSRYSNGMVGDTAPSDMSDVWMICMKSKSPKDGKGNLEWVRIMHNLLITCGAGRLTVEFELQGDEFATKYALKAEQQDNGAIVHKTGDTTSWSEEGTYMTLDIPLDPQISNYMSPVVGSYYQSPHDYHGNNEYPTSGCAVAHLYGNTHVNYLVIPHTVMADVVFYPTIYSDRIVDTNKLTGDIVTSYTPVLRINLSDLISVYKHEYNGVGTLHVHLEGLINYER